MSFFEHSTNPIVQGTTLIDVRGNQYNLQVEAQYFTDEKIFELGIDALYQATVIEALHNSRERAPPPKCHPETRRIILSDIMNWITSTRNNSRDLKRVLWLHGPAGAGKSAIAQTISELCAEAETLAGTFFFAREKDRRSAATHVFTTIAHQLATSNPHLRLTIGKAVAKNRAILEECLDDQVQQLIINPLKSVQSTLASDSAFLRPSLIVLDSLDECRDDRDHCAILDHIAALVYRHCLPLIFLVSSRPSPHIEHLFSADPTLSTISRHIALESSPDDIRIFLKSGFLKIRQQYFIYTTPLIPEDWPSEPDIETLVYRSSGYFIYAATVLQFVNSFDSWPPDQLNMVLSGQPSSFAELDQLYHQILSTVPNSQLLVRILGYILLLAHDSHDEMNYLSLAAIGSLIEVRVTDIRLTLRKMHPLLRIPATNEPGIQIIHASFADFLLSRDRSGNFHIDSDKFRIQIAHSCLKFMRGWTDPASDKSSIQFIFHNWVRFCRDAAELGGAVALIEDLQKIPDFLPDKTPQYNFKYRETKLREGAQWLLTLENVPERITQLINAQRDLCYLISLSNYGSYHYLDRVLTLPIKIVFSPEEYIQERQQRSENIETISLEDFHPSFDGAFFLWKSFQPEEHVNVDDELFKFLLDKTRSFEYFLSPSFFSTAHAKMFRSCIQTITLASDSGDYEYDYEVPPRYALKYWSRHLSRCSPDNLELISYIGSRLFLENASLQSAKEVIGWLRSFHTPPSDTLAWWEICFQSLTSQRDNCNELLEPHVWGTLEVDSMTMRDWKTLATRIEAFYLDEGDNNEVGADSGTESESEVSSYLSNTEDLSE